MSRKLFNPEQEEYLKEIYLGKFNQDIANLINEKFGTNFNQGQIVRMKYKLGLKSGYLKPKPNSGQFKKGQKSVYIAPKGTRNSPATEFKKGSIPPNRVPIGTERITKDGYVEIKVADGRGNKNWKAKQTKIWEDVNGPLPEKHAVIFLDRDMANFNLNNLALVSRAQLLLLNRKDLIKSDADLTKSGIMVAKVQDKIQKLMKQE